MIVIIGLHNTQQSHSHSRATCVSAKRSFESRDSLPALVRLSGVSISQTEANIYMSTNGHTITNIKCLVVVPLFRTRYGQTLGAGHRAGNDTKQPRERRLTTHRSPITGPTGEVSRLERSSHLGTCAGPVEVCDAASGNGRRELRARPDTARRNSRSTSPTGTRTGLRCSLSEIGRSRLLLCVCIQVLRNS